MLNLNLLDDQFPYKGINNTREVTRAFVITDDDRFMFVSIDRNDDFGKLHHIETSGGGIEKGETEQECLTRELQEELGIAVKIIQKLGVCTDFYNLINRKNISHYYLVKVVSHIKNHLTDNEKTLHMKPIILTYQEALDEYFEMKKYPVGKLISQREIPFLLEAKKITDKNS